MRRRREINFNLDFKPVGMMGWPFFSMMYMFTSDTVQPIDKMEFFWRFLSGLLNFLPI